MTIEMQNENEKENITEEDIEVVFEEIKEKFERKQRFIWKPKEKYLIEIARGVKFAGGSDLDVIVNGYGQGKIKAGKSVTVTVEDPEVELIIKSLGLNPFKAKLTVEKKAYVEVGVWKNNVIFMGMKGAEIFK